MPRLLRTIRLALCLGLFVGGEAEAQGPPNILLIYTDDQRADDVAYMPNVAERIGAEGATLSRYYATTPVCGPGRASLLRGQYAHNHGILSHKMWPEGAYTHWVESGLGHATIGTWLHDAGYRTAFVGKYQNVYPLEDDRGYVDPGWDEWFVGYSRFTRGVYYNHTHNHNGVETQYGNEAEDYRTDVQGPIVLDFMTQAVDDGVPFFAVFAPTAPHAGSSTDDDGETVAVPPDPAPRHVGTFAGRVGPRHPSYDEADVSDKPNVVRSRDRIDAEEASRIDAMWQARIESLQAIDEWVGTFLDALEARGVLGDTYVVFTSDNGYMLGEHRLRPEQKSISPYEESVRMPLLVRGPGIEQGTKLASLAAVIDLAPTFLDWAGAPLPEIVDGRSLAPVLRDGDGAHPWRTVLTTERWHLQDGTDTYQSLIGAQVKLTRWATNGFEELYDMAADPYELVNRVSEATPGQLDSLRAVLDDLATCAGAGCRQADMVDWLRPVASEGAPMPSRVEVGAPWPNPSSARVRLPVGAPSRRVLAVAVYDALGRRVLDLAPALIDGRSEIDLDVRRLAPGAYVVHVAWEGGQATRTISVLR